MGTFLLHLSSLVLVFTLRSIGGAGAGQDDGDCEVKWCNEDGPIIRFPFRLKDQPDYCGYPGFELSCSRHVTVLEFHHLANTSIKGLQLQYSMKALVNSIDYKYQRIYINIRGRDLYSLLSTIQVHSPAAAISPFKFAVANSPPDDLVDFTFFNCSSRPSQGTDNINSLSSQNFHVYAIRSTLSTSDKYMTSMISCTKMYSATILSPDGYASEVNFQLSWSTPVCRNCESKGEYCKSAANSTTTSCFPIPKAPDHVKNNKGLIAGEVDSHNSLVY